VSDLTVGVFALQGDVREHLAALAEVDVIARPVRRPSELAEVDGLVIPGGESTTMSKLSIDFGLFDPISERIKAGMPVYGSCAGMIMVARDVLDGRADQRTFGAIDMTVRRNAFGRQVDSFEAPVTIEGIDGEPFHAVFIRAPWVESVASGVTILGTALDAGKALPTLIPRDGNAAGSDGDEAAGRIVAVRQGNVLATSFHPELTGDLRIHQYFVDMVRAHVIGG
jgi:5'-phosphate synthase pdxT subunit